MNHQELEIIFESVLSEALTAEFHSDQIFGDYDSLGVKLNGTEMSLKKALQKAKIDPAINKMFYDLKQVQKDWGLARIPFIEFLNIL